MNKAQTGRINKRDEDLAKIADLFNLLGHAALFSRDFSQTGFAKVLTRATGTKWNAKRVRAAAGIVWACDRVAA